MNFIKRWRLLSGRENAAKAFAKSTLNRSLDEYARIFNQEMLNYLLKSLNSESVLLDLGAGDGIAVREMRKLGFNKVIGIDLFAENDLLIMADFLHLPFKSASIDAAISCCGLGFYANGGKEFIKQFAEIRRILKPGASLLIVFSSTLNPETKTLGTSRHGQIIFREQYLLDVAENPKRYLFEVWKYNGKQDIPKIGDSNTLFIKPSQIEALGFLVKSISYNNGLTSIVFTAN